MLDLDDRLEIPLDAALMTAGELRVELDQILAGRIIDDYPRLVDLLIERGGRRNGGTCPDWPADRKLPRDRYTDRQLQNGATP